jgi:hypothetical protein
LGATIGFGLLWFVLLPIVAVVLFVTIVGIPLGLFLLLALALVYTIGYVVGALALGRLVVKEPTSRYVAFLSGWVILRILALAASTRHALTVEWPAAGQPYQWVPTITASRGNSRIRDATPCRVTRPTSSKRTLADRCATSPLTTTSPGLRDRRES